MTNSRASKIDYELMRAHEEEGRDTAPTRTACAFCPDWTYEGTAAEGRELAAAHRKEAHPDIRPKSRRRASVPSRVKQVKMSDEDRGEIAEERRKRMFLLGIEE